MKSLGADKVLDYSSPSIVDDVVAELDKGICAGIFHAAGTVTPTLQIAQGSKHKPFVASVAPIENAPNDIEAKFIFASSGSDIYHEISGATFGGFLSDALASGAYKVAPKLEVVPTRASRGSRKAWTFSGRGFLQRRLLLRLSEK